MIIACIHDEIILEAPVDKADTAAAILQESMIVGGQHYLKSVPVVVDVSVVDTWAEK